MLSYSTNIYNGDAGAACKGRRQQNGDDRSEEGAVKEEGVVSSRPPRLAGELGPRCLYTVLVCSLSPLLGSRKQVDDSRELRGEDLD